MHDSTEITLCMILQRLMQCVRLKSLERKMQGGILYRGEFRMHDSTGVNTGIRPAKR